MAKHKESNWHGDDKLEEWMKALKQVADLSGYVYKGETGYVCSYLFSFGKC